MKAGKSKMGEMSCKAGSANIFADIGVKDPEQALLKAQIALVIGQLVRGLNMTQTQAARKLGIDQPKVSMLLRGRLRDFSIERLFRFLEALEQDIRIVVTPRNKSQRKDQRVSVELAA